MDWIRFVLCKCSHTAWTQSRTHIDTLYVWVSPPHSFPLNHSQDTKKLKETLFRSRSLYVMVHQHDFVQSGHDLNRLDNQLYTYTLTTQHDRCWKWLQDFQQMTWSHEELVQTRCDVRAAVRFSPRWLGLHVGPSPPQAAYFEPNQIESCSFFLHRCLTPRWAGYCGN